jgi:hypothetical protein
MAKSFDLPPRLSTIHQIAHWPDLALVPVMDAVKFEPTLDPHEVVEPPLIACHQVMEKFFVQLGSPEAVHFREKLLQVML